MRVTTPLLALMLVGLLVAAGVAFVIGRATAGESESSGGAKVVEINVPSGALDTPALRNVGALPDLRPEPAASGSGGATPSPESGQSGSPPSDAPTSEPPQPEPPEPPPPPPPEG